MKCFYFGLPSESVHNTALPVLAAIAKTGVEVIYYNADQFKAASSAVTFKSYPSDLDGFNVSKIMEGISYFQFAECLIDAALSLVDFIRIEIKDQKPDFILHSHLAIWGKAAASYANIPAVSFYSTFILDQSLMAPYLNRGLVHADRLAHVRTAIKFRKKSFRLQRAFGLTDELNIWDAYVNRAALNLCFILPIFQPQRTLFDEDSFYLGYPLQPTNGECNRRTIYVSMGTIFNKKMSEIHLFIEALAGFELPSIFAIGNAVDFSYIKHAPSIQLRNYVNQREVLKIATVFISRGGMASVHEAIYSLTPLIIIPEIPEQIVTAEIVEREGLGLYIDSRGLTAASLKEAISTVISNRAYFVKNIEKARKLIPATIPEIAAASLIQRYVNYAMRTTK